MGCVLDAFLGFCISGRVFLFIFSSLFFSVFFLFLIILLTFSFFLFALLALLHGIKILTHPFFSFFFFLF